MPPTLDHRSALGGGEQHAHGRLLRWAETLRGPYAQPAVLCQGRTVTIVSHLNQLRGSLAHFSSSRRTATVGTRLGRTLTRWGVPIGNRRDAALHLPGVCWPLKPLRPWQSAKTRSSGCPGGLFGPAGTNRPVVWPVLPLRVGTHIRSPPKPTEGRFYSSRAFPRPPESGRSSRPFSQDQTACGAGAAERSTGSWWGAGLGGWVGVSGLDGGGVWTKVHFQSAGSFCRSRVCNDKQNRR